MRLSIASAMVGGVLLSACGDGGTSTAARKANEVPERGGTLRLIGTTDIDHLSTTSGNTMQAAFLFRAFTRQLFAYPTAPSYEEQTEVVPDLATTLPTRENGGISSDYTTYTVHIRQGARWNSSPPRQVTATDQVRGFKLLCNPVLPSGGLVYYLPTIAGLKTFCGAFAKVPPTAAAIRTFVDTHEIDGVRALDDSTVQFHLTQPASDFLHILARHFGSPVPVEYLAYVPDDAESRRHTLSDGPYRITSYLPNRELTLGRNPAWDPASDPIRKAWVDSIRVDETSNGTSAQQQLESGVADLPWDAPPPAVDVTRLLASGDPRLLLAPGGDHVINMKYLVVNALSPSQQHALARKDVRQALQYAVDRAAIAQALGGSAVARPHTQVVLPFASGYRAGFDPYPSAGAHGDSAKAQQMLSAAGFPRGVVLKLALANGPASVPIATTLQQSFRRVGVTVTLMPFSPADFWGKLLGNPDAVRRGDWDLALTEIFPDWQGNNGRTTLALLFDGRTFGPNTQNFGGYDNPDVNNLIDRALAARTRAEADSLWALTAARVADDAPILPLVVAKAAVYVGPRVRGCLVSAAINCDLTNVWLAGTSTGGRP